MRKHLLTKVYTIPNLYAEVKKFSKLLYTPLKVGFRLIVVVNLPCSRIISTSGKDKLSAFSYSIKNDMLM